MDYCYCRSEFGSWKAKLECAGNHLLNQSRMIESVEYQRNLACCLAFLFVLDPSKLPYHPNTEEEVCKHSRGRCQVVLICILPSLSVV